MTLYLFVLIIEMDLDYFNDTVKRIGCNKFVPSELAMAWSGRYCEVGLKSPLRMFLVGWISSIDI